MDHAPVQYSGHGALLFVVELQSDPLQTETTQSVNEEEPATRTWRNIKCVHCVCVCVCGSRWRTIGSEGFFSNATSFILVSSAPLMCPALPLVYTSAPLFSYVCIAVCYERKRRYINVLYQKEKQTFQPFFMHIIQLLAQKFKSQIIRTDEIIMTPVSSMTLQRKPFCQHSLFICSFNICSEVEN